MNNSLAFENPFRIEQGLVLSPLAAGTWPGQENSYLYWLARRKFRLDTAPSSAALAVVADRHYEVFINRQRMVSQRNYFSGDRYLYRQDHREAEMAAALTAGDNEIVFLLRSDAYKNKNYTYCHPLLWCELSFPDSTGLTAVFSDAQWEVARLENWRPLRACVITRSYELAKLIPEAECGLRGTPGKAVYSHPCTLDPETLPPIYKWTEKPQRTDTHRPTGILFSGTWAAKQESLCFDLTEIFRTGGNAPVLTTVLHLHQETQIAISASALSACSLLLDGTEAASRDWLPGPDLMRQMNYLSPQAMFTLPPGTHELSFRFHAGHRRFLSWKQRFADSPNIAGLWFRLQVHGYDQAALEWHNCDGQTIRPRPLDCSTAESLSARTAQCDRQNVQQTAADSFTFLPTGKNDRQFLTLAYGGLKKGRLSFRIHAASAGRIYLSYGILAGNGAIDCARNRKDAVDIIEVPAGDSQYEAFEDRALAFLDLACENFSGRVEIRDLALHERIFLDPSAAAFESTDTAMNALWRASIRTAQLCCDEIYMDNFEREHTQWLCSSPPNIAAGYYFFAGNRSKADKTLLELALHQRADGELQGHAPGFWGERPAYQCHIGLYIRAVWRNYHYHGNLTLLKQLLPTLKKILSYWENWRNADGLLEDLHTVWVDWGIHMYSYAPVDNQRCAGILTAINAYYLGALRMIAELAAETSDREYAGKCSGWAEQTAGAMRDLLFDQQRNLFRDGQNNSAEGNYSQQANAVAALYGVFPPAKCREILQRAFGPAEDRQDIIQASPHFALLTGEALFESGLDSLAWEWLRRHETMLSANADTIWEAWSPQVCHCQGPGAAIAYHLGRYHAGVYPARPGFATIGIHPHSCGQQRLKAVLNTHYGLIGIEWQRRGNACDYLLSLPPALQNRPLAVAPGVNLQLRQSN